MAFSIFFSKRTRPFMPLSVLPLSCIGMLCHCPLWITTSPKKLSLGYHVVCSRPTELHSLIQPNSHCQTLYKSEELKVNCDLLIHPAKSYMHERGIEPRSPKWQARILPLNHSCSMQIVKWLKVGDWGEHKTLPVGQQIMQLDTNQAWNSSVSFSYSPKSKWATEQGKAWKQLP